MIIWHIVLGDLLLVNFWLGPSSLDQAPEFTFESWGEPSNLPYLFTIFPSFHAENLVSRFQVPTQTGLLTWIRQSLTWLNLRTMVKPMAGIMIYFPMVSVPNKIEHYSEGPAQHIVSHSLRDVKPPVHYCFVLEIINDWLGCRFNSLMSVARACLKALVHWPTCSQTKYRFWMISENPWWKLAAKKGALTCLYHIPGSPQPGIFGTL